MRETGEQLTRPRAEARERLDRRPRATGGLLDDDDAVARDDHVARAERDRGLERGDERGRLRFVAMSAVAGRTREGVARSVGRDEHRPDRRPPAAGKRGAVAVNRPSPAHGIASDTLPRPGPRGDGRESIDGVARARAGAYVSPVSKAFTKDDDDSGDELVPARAPLPDGVPNYVTSRGMAALRSELDALLAEREAISHGDRDGSRRELARATTRIHALEARVASAELVAKTTHEDEVRFGATVVVRGDDGEEHRCRIVGVDEADAERGDVAFVAPLARALLGKHVGDEATVRAPGGKRAVEIVGISYDG